MSHLSSRQLVAANNAIHGENAPLPAPRKKPDHEESREQQAVIIWWKWKCRQFGIAERLLFAVPNGAKRDAVVGAILKREGVRAGTSDLILLVPRNGLHGMCIEMKKRGGFPSPDQKAFIAETNAQGYRALVCYGYIDAVDAITAYLTP